MKKQFLFAAGAIILVVCLFLMGKTTAPKQPVSAEAAAPEQANFNVQRFLNQAKGNLTASQTLYVSELENSVTRGDVVDQQIKAYQSLANFWKDSAKTFEGYAWYSGQAAKLENSEKSLNFAAQLFLNNLRVEHDEAKLKWETAEAIELFEQALKLNPESVDLKIGLGSAYVFGTANSGDPQKTMMGIQQLLSVVRADSTNMRAQLVLGIGGFVSAQYENALERFKKVVAAEPNNLEAIAFLADTYAALNNVEEATKWYNVSKRLANNPHYTKEVDERIQRLSK